MLYSHGIRRKPAPVESHSSIGLVEQCHEPLRRIHAKLRMGHPDAPTRLALSCAVFAMNETLGPEGLAPFILALGIMPKLAFGDPKDAKHLHQPARFSFMRSARAECETIVPKLRMKTAETRVSASSSTPAIRR